MQRTIHVAITRRVKAGAESAFENAIKVFFAESAMQEGALGAQLLKPLPGSKENTYGIIRSFASEADRDAFYRSDHFRQWEEIIQPLVEPGYSRKNLHGLEAFFTDPDRIRNPPRWKMAVVTWLGVWPTVYLTAIWVSPYSRELPPWMAVGIDTLMVVLALTWVVMPVLTRILRAWLVKPTGADGLKRSQP